jgi:hypothetical protein
LSTWVKGQSGNPSGRPKEDADVAEAKRLARVHGPTAIARLAELAKSEDERVSVSACQAILDRAYGKPTQTVEGEVHQFNYDALVLEHGNGSAT